MQLTLPSGIASDLKTLCRKWHDENRALADDLLARRIVHTERIAGEWHDVSTEDADRHARIAAELERLLDELDE
jgi:hypothetical protein